MKTVEIGQEEISLDSVQGGNERILIVDDEPVIVQVIKRQLEMGGYHVTAATSSKKALEKIRTGSTHFDLLVTDQTMPVLTGVELSKAVQEISPDLPIILCTGLGHVLSSEEALKLGIQKIVLKPIFNNALLDAVRSVLDATSGRPLRNGGGDI